MRRLRERQNLTQERAAELIGLHGKHVQRIERGAANVTLATLVAIAVAFDVKVMDLFQGE